LAKFGNITKEKESTTEAAISKGLKAEMTVNAGYINMKKLLTT
jgi:hypothetical protein